MLQPKRLSQKCDGKHIAISHRGHGSDRPPPRVLRAGRRGSKKTKNTVPFKGDHRGYKAYIRDIWGLRYVLSSWLLALWLSSEASLLLTLLDFSREKHGFPIHGGLATHASVHTQTL